MPEKIIVAKFTLQFNKTWEEREEKAKVGVFKEKAKEGVRARKKRPQSSFHPVSLFHAENSRSQMEKIFKCVFFILGCCWVASIHVITLDNYS